MAAMLIGLSARWTWGSFTIALLFSLPLLAIFIQALAPDAALFSHLAATVLPDYITNSALLVIGVMFIALLMAVPAAWLVARCDFFGHSYLQWALLLPLAMPAYIVAYVYTDLLDYAGPVQISLRRLFAWSSPQDYYFPDIRSVMGASLVLALTLFPYIYLLAKTAFKEQSTNVLNAARVMGCSTWHSFFRLSLPMARPAIAVGLSLVAMETLADFATVSYFAVPTLTTAVYDTWLEYGSLAAASKLSSLMLLVVFLLIGTERFARRKQALFQKQSQITPLPKYRLSPWQSTLAFGYCFGLLTLAFVIPFTVLLGYAVNYFSESWNMKLLGIAWNSLAVAVAVSVSCVFIALLLLFVRRVSPRNLDILPSRAVSMGYAIPGTVLAIGVLIPLTQLDFAINDVLLWLGAAQPGLVLSGSLLALVFAFSIRFIAIAVGSIESSYKNVSPTLDMAAITMGKQPRQILTMIHYPLIRKGLFAGLLLVFIETMKELPAALILKPIGFENLATYAYQFASDEQLEHAAFAAIAIVLVGLVPLIYLNRSMDQGK